MYSGRGRLSVMSHERKLNTWAFALAAFFLISASLHGQAWAAPQEAGKDGQRKPVTITSDMMEAKKEENIVFFKGNVEAVEDFTLCSDELTVHYGDANEVNKIIAHGGVRIFHGDKTATSDTAVYNRGERTIVLTGSPQVNQCGGTVKGDKITVYIDRDNALIESETGGRVRAVIMPDKKCRDKGASEEKGAGEETRCKGPR